MMPYSSETELFVVDTNTIIYYYENIFGGESALSQKANKIVDDAVKSLSPFVNLSIPSIVFVEIFEKWLVNEEFTQKFYFEVFTELSHSPNVQIRPLDKEVLTQLLKISGSLDNHEINDKIVLASAMALNCPLITSDPKIHQYVNETKVIPYIMD